MMGRNTLTTRMMEMLVIMMIKVMLKRRMMIITISYLCCTVRHKRHSHSAAHSPYEIMH